MTLQRLLEPTIYLWLYIFILSLPDSLHNARECIRLGIQSGRNTRARDIAAWARKKRKSIRRDELLAFLCGKSMPSHCSHKFRHNKTLDRQVTRLGSNPSETIGTTDYSFGNSIALQGKALYLLSLLFLSFFYYILVIK